MLVSGALRQWLLALEDAAAGDMEGDEMEISSMNTCFSSPCKPSSHPVRYLLTSNTLRFMCDPHT